MSLRAIVNAVGGDLYAGGCAANIPAPGHSPHDRSVSLRYDHGRVIVHAFSQTAWFEVLDWLREQGLIDAHNRPILGAGGSNGARGGVCDPPALPDVARRAVAAALWEAGRSIVGTPAARHFGLRAYPADQALPGPDVVRFRHDIPLRPYAGDAPGRRLAAMMVAVRDRAGELTAMEITYLTEAGHKPPDLRLPRKTIGLVPPGSAVRLDACAPEMLVAEGVFTALSARRLFGRPAWALQSVRNLRTWVAPDGVRDVLIARDQGRPGLEGAEVLAERLRAQGVRVRIEGPLPPYGDWNDYAVALARAAVLDAGATKALA
jgi:hypothetical protein